MQPVKSGGSIPEFCYTESQGYQVAVCPPTLLLWTYLRDLRSNAPFLSSLLMCLLSSTDTCYADS